MITFDEFKAVELKVAKILEAENHPDADRLYLLKIDLGEEQRQIVAGIKAHYSTEELVGRQIIVVANLQPAEIRGVQSNGMLLAARTEQSVILISPDQEIPLGTRLS